MAAGVPEATRPVLLTDFRNRPDIYRNWRGVQIEPVTVALMVHGN